MTMQFASITNYHTLSRNKQRYLYTTSIAIFFFHPQKTTSIRVADVLDHPLLTDIWS